MKKKTTLSLITSCSLLLTVGLATGQTSFDWTPGTTIADNNPTGVADTRLITFDPAAVITGLEVRLHLTGGWNGDMYASLVHDSGFTVLLNRPGNTAENPGGSGSSGMNVTFSAAAASDIHVGIADSGVITGIWQPDARTADPSLVTDLSPRTAFLSSFNESPVQGSWTLFLADNAASDTSVLAGWGLTIQSETRGAIWDGNASTGGVGGGGTWSASSGSWATSDSGTSTAAQNTNQQLVFRGTASEVTVDGTVSPRGGLRFETSGYSLTGGTIQLQGATAAANSLTVDADVSTSVSSVISGSNGMSKMGGGILTLNGENTFTGNTIVAAGTLKLGAAGSIATSSVITVGNAGSTGATLDTTDKSGFVVGPTQTLNGIGTVNAGEGKTVTINGTHSPGNSPGIQSVTGNLNYSATSMFSWELNDEVVGERGVNYDAVNVTGALTIESGAAFHATVTGLDITQTFWDANRSWNVFDASSVTGTFTTFQLFDAASPATPVSFASQGTFTLTNTGSLNWTAVPEASNALVGLLVGCALLRRRRAN